MAKTKTSNRAYDAIDAKWQAENDLRSLMEVECIKKDPKRYAAARKLAKERLEEYQELASGKEESAADEAKEYK